MTWTRAGQIGPQLGTTAEWTATLGEGFNPTISTTKVHHSGYQTYSVRFIDDAGHKASGLSFPSAVQIRGGVWLNHNGLGGDTSIWIATLLRWVSSSGSNNYVRWRGDTANLDLIVNNVVVDSVSIGSSTISPTDTWHHIAIAGFASATIGWISIYANGIKILEATGLNTGTAFFDLYFGGSITLGWAASAYFNDFYVDTSDGSEPNEAPPKKSFLWSVANGNGYTSQWTGSDADSTDNYLLVDEIPPDNDTTYVEAEEVDLVDAYACADIASLPAGYNIIARIPTALGKRLGTTEKMILGNYDGAIEELGSEKIPPASYGPVWDRFEAQPDASDWNLADFNAAQTVIKSAGTF